MMQELKPHVDRAIVQYVGKLLNQRVQAHLASPSTTVKFYVQFLKKN